MRKMDKKEVHMTQNAGNNHDVIIEDLGEGFSNEVYEYLENNMGYEINLAKKTQNILTRWVLG
jgi:hypothetical protein